MNDDEKEAIAQEVLKEDANRERGERPEWRTHEGWHRREDTGRFGSAARARAAARDAEAKKKKLYHDGWEAEAEASAEALMARPETRPPSPAPSGREPSAEPSTKPVSERASGSRAAVLGCSGGSTAPGWPRPLRLSIS